MKLKNVIYIILLLCMFVMGYYAEASQEKMMLKSKR